MDKARTSLDHLTAFRINFLKTMQAQLLLYLRGSKLYFPGAQGLKIVVLCSSGEIILTTLPNFSLYGHTMWNINGPSGMCHQLIQILLNSPLHDYHLECIGNLMS